LLTAIGARGPGDPRLIPFLALFFTMANLVALPVANAFSRRIEAAADRTAIEVTRDPEGAIMLEVNLARDNLADLEPNAFIRWAFFSHPPVLDRIQIALDYEERE
jgi:STE24 endopeptidase